jgi:hypothetical protein
MLRPCRRNQIRTALRTLILLLNFVIGITSIEQTILVQTKFSWSIEAFATRSE